jgi:hypothetical protein
MKREALPKLHRRPMKAAFHDGRLMRLVFPTVRRQPEVGAIRMAVEKAVTSENSRVGA